MEEREFCACHLACYIRCLSKVQEAVLCNLLHKKENTLVLYLSSFPFSQYSKVEVLESSIEESLLSDYQVFLPL